MIESEWISVSKKTQTQSFTKSLVCVGATVNLNLYYKKDKVEELCSNTNSILPILKI